MSKQDCMRACVCVHAHATRVCLYGGHEGVFVNTRGKPERLRLNTPWMVLTLRERCHRTGSIAQSVG